MGKVFFANIIGLVFIAALVYALHGNVESNERYIEEITLKEVIDNSSEAAMTTVLMSQDLEVDYENMNEIDIDPYVAIDAFVLTLLKSYNVEPTKENIQGVKLENIPVFVIASGDGYYLARIQQEKATTNGTPRFDLVFDVKKPYTYSEGGNMYGLTLGNQGYYKIDADGNTSFVKQPFASAELSAEKVGLHITDKIVSDIKATIDSYADNEYSGWTSNFYMPKELSEISVRDTNIIEGPSVIALAQNINFGFKEPLSMFSVAGNKLVINRPVVGFKEGLVHYYTFLDKLPASVTDYRVFESMRDAAEKGFTPHLKSLK